MTLTHEPLLSKIIKDELNHIYTVDKKVTKCNRKNTNVALMKSIKK